MKITKITPLVLGTPWRNLTFLKVETDEGLVGWGEGRNVNRTEALLGFLSGAAKRYVIGSDPFKIESLVHRMFVEDFARIDDVAGMGIALVEIFALFTYSLKVETRIRNQAYAPEWR